MLHYFLCCILVRIMFLYVIISCTGVLMHNGLTEQSKNIHLTPQSMVQVTNRTYNFSHIIKFQALQTYYSISKNWLKKNKISKKDKYLIFSLYYNIVVTFWWKFGIPQKIICKYVLRYNCVGRNIIQVPNYFAAA